MAEYTFRKPYEFEGKTYEKIEFDLDSLKGSDVAAIKKQLNAAGVYPPVCAVDCEFCAAVIARLIKQPPEFMEQMDAKDYAKLTLEVTNFFGSSD